MDIEEQAFRAGWEALEGTMGVQCEPFSKSVDEAWAEYSKPEKSCDRTCKFWTYGMDGAYCSHPKSYEIAPMYGASTNRMSTEGQRA